MRIQSLMRKLAGGGMLAASLLLATPMSALACTQVYVGSSLTENGSTYVGRAEDYNPRYVKCFGIQERLENPQFRSFENDAVVGSGFEYTYQGTGYRYTYVRDIPSAWDAQDDPIAKRVYSEVGTNERGVSVSATLTTDYNDAIAAVDPLVPTGIGEYNLADFILSVADTAKDGVVKLGRVIDQHGSQDCNQIIIADNAETWIFCQLSGHQWIAWKMGSDVASVNPNMGRLQYKADLDDETSCLHSANVVKLAQDHNLLQSYDDGTPNIAKTYGKQDPGAGQNTRLAQGRAYFGAPLEEGTDYTVDSDGRVTNITDPQLTFIPGGKVDTFKALRSLAARGEQTEKLNANTNSKLYAIGNNRNVENHIFEIRAGKSADIATIHWEALSRAEFSVFLPIYSALLTEVPSEYYPAWDTVTADHQGKAKEDSVEKAMEEEPGKNLDYVLMDINTLAYNNRSTLASGVRTYLDALQKEIIAQHAEADKQMSATPEDEREAFANELFAQVTSEAYNKLKPLLNEMRAHLKGASAAEPFVPSDLNAETGTMKTPLAYFVAPAPKPQSATITISAQPTSATYELGDKTTPLTVEAQALAADGTDLSEDLLYQWYRRDNSGDFVPVEGAHEKTLAVSSEKEGTEVYRVELSLPMPVAAGTNPTDAENAIDSTTVVSEEATITVLPKKQPRRNYRRAHLAQTGDAALISACLANGAGILLAGAGAVMVARKRR
ncbi:C69 family dipeptidase [Collinsella sp. AGMB00827]|uniref:C69 family dipeptidase n=1 Tax=Collinsella ureilytica TaxID=2869515 RepID=A0ABS7MJF8_9ACTN|nr:C69 family dipeptidase [Collinsella urealyticum]MBY4797502.1 C69 family dipeptidase [Collinsella urealyticum]